MCLHSKPLFIICNQSSLRSVSRLKPRMTSLPRCCSCFPRTKSQALVFPAGLGSSQSWNKSVLRHFRAARLREKVHRSRRCGGQLRREKLKLEAQPNPGTGISRQHPRTTIRCNAPADTRLCLRIVPSLKVGGEAIQSAVSTLRDVSRIEMPSMLPTRDICLSTRCSVSQTDADPSTLSSTGTSRSAQRHLHPSHSRAWMLEMAAARLQVLVRVEALLGYTIQELIRFDM